MLHIEILKQYFKGKVADSHDGALQLKEICDRYPYFSLAQYFALKQMKESGRDDTGRSAVGQLHFSEPAYLQCLLNAVPDHDAFVTADAGVAYAETGKDTAMQRAVHADENISNENETLPNDDIKPATMNEPAALTRPAPQPATGTTLLFEPLYTTDYFASQGIKLSEEVQAGDKLGKQLKSFTEWLKTMKKVHDSRLPQGSEQLDASVNRLAEKSNREEEVLTEAMAEAYLVQGKKEKARETYLKLSLLDPSKNAYFAAKINEIGARNGD